MPLREDLLDPIPGDNPSGPDLKYDKTFEQIKEARIEEDDLVASGEWSRAPKKADRPLVIKLAGDMLAKRTKDVRLLAWYLESLIRREGLTQLPAGLKLLKSLEETFWETVHPEIDEDGDAGLRVGAVESLAALLAPSVKAVPLTRSGFSYLQYLDARAVGLESDATTSEKRTVRAEAIERGRSTGEDLQKAIEKTPKAFYVDTESILQQTLQEIDELDEFHQDKYTDPVSLGKLRSSVEDIAKVVRSILAEKRKLEPDPVPQAAPEEAPVEEVDAFAQYDNATSPPAQNFAPAAELNAPAAAPVPVSRPRPQPGAAVIDAAGAFAQAAACAEFLRKENASSTVPYLLCAALRLGETRGADLADASFAIAPSTETRQALRKLANDGNWDELMQLCLRMMTEPCGRTWLDLQRYTWRAASESGNSAIATAVVSTVRGLLIDLPALRELKLDDDTPVANPETLQWIGMEVLPPVKVEEPSPEPAYVAPVYAQPVEAAEEPKTPDIYEIAQQTLKRGKIAESISLLARDSESQPSGRMRFLRRVQMAQLCLMADQPAVAYPILQDLANEMERRALESWEASEMLAQPLSLLLRCLDHRQANEEARDAVFARLCRLDPQTALSVRQ